MSLVQAAVKKAISKNIETKRSVFTTTDGVSIAHNNFITLDSQLLLTTNGPYDPSTTQAQNRIGDEINLKGVALKGMVELLPDRSDVTIRILVVKAAKGDTPTRATLFNGLSGNKMLDTINTERYTVLRQKYVKLRAPNIGTYNSNFNVATGVYNATTSQSFTRSTKIWKMWIPGKSLIRSGIVKYESDGAQTKFFDYHVLMYAYCTGATPQDINDVATSNDYIRQMFFKDA